VNPEREVVELIHRQLCQDCPVHRQLKEAERIRQDLEIRLRILENVRALAWKWGAGAGAAIGLVVTVGHAIWEMLTQ